jgi:hypothetical protein
VPGKWEPLGRCSGHEDDLADLALGIVTGRDRARALVHIDECRWCSSELDRLAILADKLLELAPSSEPPIGFEVGVVERFRNCGQEVLRCRSSSDIPSVHSCGTRWAGTFRVTANTHRRTSVRRRTMLNALHRVFTIR